MAREIVELMMLARAVLDSRQPCFDSDEGESCWAVDVDSETLNAMESVLVRLERDS